MGTHSSTEMDEMGEMGTGTFIDEMGTGTIIIFLACLDF